MSTNEEENPPVPNWLLKLEEQRERRLKARLGHEAGAGAKCQKCEDKCPGLDLHFWRKICKACKCGKEDHDVVDDDIYGYVQFQLLGSKPLKPKGVLVPGVPTELEWLPGGSASDVGRYLAELPVEALPVRGSAGAKLRRQRLQRQLPPHDIDAALCHQLTPQEERELLDYVAHVKNHCVGQGKIIRLSLFKGQQHKPANTQFLSQFPPSQVASSQTVSLQSSDISNNLQNLSIRDPKQKLPSYNPQNHQPVIDNQNPQKIAQIVHPLTTSNVERHQEQFENPSYLNSEQGGQNTDLKYPNEEIPPPINNSTHPLMQYSTVNNVKVPLQQYNPQFVNPVENTVLPSKIGQPKDLKYPSNTEQNVPKDQNPLNANYIDPKTGLVVQTPLNANVIDQNLIPNQIGGVRNQIYPLGQPHLHKNNQISSYIDPKTGLVVQNPSNANIIEQNLLPNQYGNIRDQMYPLGQPDLNQIAANYSSYDPKSQIPNYEAPNIPIGSGMPAHGDQNSNPKSQLPIYEAQAGLNPSETLQNLQNVGHMRNIEHPVQNVPKWGDTQSQLPIFEAQTTLNPSETLQNAQNMGYIRNIEHQNIPQGDQNSNQRYPIPVFQAQTALNPSETFQNLQSVGYIRDIEAPLQTLPPNSSKSGEMPQGEQGAHQAPIPKCHACKDQFEDGAVAIAADRTTNLWHSKCFNCHKCEQPLADLVYFYHKDTDDIYCGRDYAELKGIPRCQACDELIFVKEYCLAEDKTFHVKHFCCFECDEPLAGKEYVLESEQPVCIACFEHLKADRCADCGEPIRPHERGASLKGLHWHAEPECFACKKCRKGLLGEKMLLRDNMLFCSDLCFKSF